MFLWTPGCCCGNEDAEDCFNPGKEYVGMTREMDTFCDRVLDVYTSKNGRESGVYVYYRKKEGINVVSKYFPYPFPYPGETDLASFFSNENFIPLAGQYAPTEKLWWHCSFSSVYPFMETGFEATYENLSSRSIYVKNNFTGKTYLKFLLTGVMRVQFPESIILEFNDFNSSSLLNSPGTISYKELKKYGSHFFCFLGKSYYRTHYKNLFIEDIENYTSRANFRDLPNDLSVDIPFQPSPTEVKDVKEQFFFETIPDEIKYETSFAGFKTADVPILIKRNTAVNDGKLYTSNLFWEYEEVQSVKNRIKSTKCNFKPYWTTSDGNPYFTASLFILGCPIVNS